MMSRETSRYADGPVHDVHLGQVTIATAPASLVAAALGSCVAVALYDPLARIGGLAHVMLPVASSDRYAHVEPGRFAEWAVPELRRRLVEAGCSPAALGAKIAGGAAMFSSEKTDGIGERNVAEVKRQLALMSIPLLAEDTGGGHARTVTLVVDSGELFVRSGRLGTRLL